MVKRFFAMFLVITAVLCLYAGPAPAEAENLDSAAFETFIAANATREMLARNGNALSVREDLRTIRIVYDPDTAHEKTAEAVLPVNTWFSAFHNGAFIQEFFSDRECTQPFYDCYVREDLVLYALSE